ncbi:MAG: FAD:protein FMN transferase, partial [Acidimicrobiia bacterium]
MISRRRFIRDMSGVIAGAGLVGLPVWKWATERQRVDRYVQAMMGTEVEIVLIGLDRDAAASAAGQAFAAMAVAANRLTIFDPHSALNDFNASAGTGPVRIGADLEAVLLQAETIRSRTEGAFTPAILPLSRLWRPTETRVPEAVTIEEGL